MICEIVYVLTRDFEMRPVCVCVCVDPCVLIPDEATVCVGVWVCGCWCMLHVCTCSLVFTTIPLYESSTTFPQHLVITSKL